MYTYALVNVKDVACQNTTRGAETICSLFKRISKS